MCSKDMIPFRFSARHWQQIEAGRPIKVTTVLRICEAFHVSIGQLSHIWIEAFTAGSELEDYPMFVLPLLKTDAK